MAAKTANAAASSASTQAKNAFVRPSSASYQLAPITTGTSTPVSSTISRPSPSTPTA